MAVPGESPDTTPALLIRAMKAGEQLHVPPVVGLLSVIVLPAQKGMLPVIGRDSGFTVTVATTVPHTAVYDTITVPLANAVTTPAMLTPATGEDGILQVPPGTELLNVIALPGHRGAFPVIGPGSGFTVTITDADPQELVYKTVAVPAPTALSVPEELIVATEEGATLQAPPVAGLVSKRVPPEQTGVLPVIGPDTALTVITTVAVPQVVV